MTDSAFAVTPTPPYYAVIFTSLRTAVDAGYGDTADRMMAMAAARPGYLGVESTRGAEGLGITVSYWTDLEAIKGWRADVDHSAARALGRSDWYEHFEVRIARVERAYGK